MGGDSIDGRHRHRHYCRRGEQLHRVRGLCSGTSTRAYAHTNCNAHTYAYPHTDANSYAYSQSHPNSHPYTYADSATATATTATASPRASTYSTSTTPSVPDLRRRLRLG